MHLLWLISRDDWRGLNYLCNPWRREGERGKKGRQRRKRKTFQRLHNVNKPPSQVAGKERPECFGLGGERVEWVWWVFFFSAFFFLCLNHTLCVCSGKLCLGCSWGCRLWVRGTGEGGSGGKTVLNASSRGQVCGVTPLE